MYKPFRHRAHPLLRPLNRFPVAALLTMQFCAQPVTAQPDYTEMSLKELMALEMFTAASLLPTEYAKAPGTVYRFDREDFDRFGVRRLDDLLQLVPGFQLNQYRKRHRSIWARGVLDRYNDKLLLLVDGIRRRQLYYGHFSLGDNLPLEAVEQVEIVLGPASSLYGANAFGGIVSITTRAFAERPRAEMTLEVGDNARGKGTLLYNGPTVQAFGSYLTQDAPFRDDRRSFIGGDTLQPLDEEYGSLYLKIRPLPGLTLTLDHRREETPFLFIPETQDARIEAHPLTLAAHYAAGDPDRKRIEVKLHYTRDDVRELEIEQATRRPGYLEHQDGTTAGAEVTGFLRLPGHHVVALGGAWRHERADDMDYVRWFHFQDGFLDPPLRGSLLSQPDIRNDDFALYLQDVWSIRPDLTLTLGARYDSYQAFGGHDNYRAALVYTPAERQVWKLLYGTAIRTPGFREYLKVLEGTDFVPPTPDPERIRTLELGYLYQWDVANLSVTLFRNEIEGYIHETPTPDGTDEYFANSDAPWRMQGAEALMQFRLDRRWQLRLGAAYLDAVQRDTGDLPYLAQWSGSLNLGYGYAADHSAGLTLVCNGSRSDTNETAEDDPGGLLLVNLYGSGRLADDLSYSLGVDNLLDERVYDPAADFGSRYNPERSRREVWGRLRWGVDL